MLRAGPIRSRMVETVCSGGRQSLALTDITVFVQPEVRQSCSKMPASFFNEIRRLRIENQELRAADHRLKAEICDLKANILALYGQLSKCRQLARAFNNCVS